MILPMKKVSIVLLNKEREASLKKLRKLGLVHLETLNGSGEKLAAFKEISNNSLISESILSEIKLSKSQKKQDVKELKDDEIVSLTKEIVVQAERKKQLLDVITADVNELDRFAGWGNVSLEDFEYLKERGIQLKMYEIPSSKYSSIDESIDTLLVNTGKKVNRFLIINGGEGRPEKLLPDAFEVSFPKESTSVIENEVRQAEREIVRIEEFFAKKAVYLQQIKDYKKRLLTDIEFENVNSGMAHENENEQTDLAWISGFVPEEDLETLKSACRENEWALAYSEPEDEDLSVPTKLKNNKFVSIIYPLTDFLGTVPGYHEYDISGWFLLFFSIFFGMIFGDGGYGLILTAAFILIMFKNLITRKKNPPLLSLGIILGISTIIWGTVTCTWFGIPAQQLPDFLKNISVKPLSNAYTDELTGFTTDQNLQIFCFTIALLQLSIAHIKGMIANKKSLKFFGEFGSLLQLIGMYYIVLNLVVSSEHFALNKVINNIPIGYVELGFIAVGFVLSFIFANYEGSVLKSVLASVKGIIPVILGVVNVFSDIVSYIRLWAVGLAGAAISATVNTMAGPILGHAILFAIGIILLVFGHGLNMVLNLLSVLVHGVRLNTLEFSSHLGMSWSGIKYSPFAEKGNE
ncbi:MAG: ATPase [Treponema sp.]|nr:ATPase [Treponema sp.]